MDRLVAIVDKRPELAGQIVEAMCKDNDYGYDSSRKVSPTSHLVNFMNDDRPAVRAAGVHGLSTDAISKIDFEKMLADPAVEVRIEAVNAFGKRLNEWADSSVKNTVGQRDVVSGFSSGEADITGEEPEPSLLGSIIQGIFGGAAPPSRIEPNRNSTDKPNVPSSSSVEPAISEARPSSQAIPEMTKDNSQTDQADLANQDVRNLLPTEAREEWLANWIAHKEGRPDWATKSEPLLETMSKATDSKERFPAMLDLIALDPTPERVAAAYDVALTNADMFQKMGGLLPWLPLDARTELLEKMFKVRRYQATFSQLVNSFALVRSLSTADVLWQHVDDQAIKPLAMFSAIVKATFGNEVPYYRALSKDDHINKYLIKQTSAQMQTKLRDPKSSRGDAAGGPGAAVLGEPRIGRSIRR